MKNAKWFLVIPILNILIAVYSDLAALELIGDEFDDVIKMFSVLLRIAIPLSFIVVLRYYKQHTFLTAVFYVNIALVVLLNVKQYFQAFLGLYSYSQFVIAIALMFPAIYLMAIFVSNKLAHLQLRRWFMIYYLCMVAISAILGGSAWWKFKGYQDIDVLLYALPFISNGTLLIFYLQLPKFVVEEKEEEKAAGDLLSRRDVE